MCGADSCPCTASSLASRFVDFNLVFGLDFRGNLNLVRAAELKHCRVAMLATVGWAWTATGTHFEGVSGCPATQRAPRTLNTLWAADP